MNTSKALPLQLEILVSTVNRTSLEFLHAMFQHNQLDDFHILVVNQTTPNHTLHSSNPKIRVINSYDKGLSKSRNLAIENAVGDICLLADDDVVYIAGFEKCIINGYGTLPAASIICFKTLTTENLPYSQYPKKIGHLSGFKYVLSIEISFKRLPLVNNKIRFNEHFGLGAIFQDSENYIFLKELNTQNKLKAFFVPEFIVIHEPLSSSDDISSDRFIFARSALNFKFFGYFAYVYILKLIFFLLRKNLIKFNDIGHKFKVAHSGIETYKTINHQKK